eukprot:4509065-Alexandrium_andersonii.AAC.1
MEVQKKGTHTHVPELQCRNYGAFERTGGQRALARTSSELLCRGPTPDSLALARKLCGRGGLAMEVPRVRLETIPRVHHGVICTCGPEAPFRRPWQLAQPPPANAVSGREEGEGGLGGAHDGRQ